MKRDWDTVRLILTKLEELPDSLSTLELLDFYDDERGNPDGDFYDLDNRISYHMALLRTYPKRSCQTKIVLCDNF